jgi:hypothetical protein
MPGVPEVTEVERRIAQLLRNRVERTIDEHGFEWAAANLKMSVPGVEAVLWKREWTAAMALHLAGLLGVLTERDVDKLEVAG